MRLLALPLLAVLALPSCSTVQSARDDLNAMPEAEYQELNENVLLVSHAAGAKLSELLSDKPELLSDINALATQLQHTVQSDTLHVSDMLAYLVDRFADDLELKPEYQEYIRDGAKVIDAAVGQIRLGIDGSLSERERGLLLSLLQGLASGTSTQ